MKKKLLSGILCIAMIVIGCSGCGQKEPDSQSNTEMAYSEDSTGNAKSQLAKQGVYSVEAIDLTGILAENQYITVVESFCAGDYFYMAVREENEQPVRLISMKKDGTDVKMVEPEQESAEETTSQNIFHTISYTHYQVSTDGSILAVKTDSYADLENPDQTVERTEVSVCCWNAQGKIRWEKELTEPQIADKQAYVGALCALQDQTVAVMLGGKLIGKYILDMEGNLSDLQPMGDFGGAFLRFTQIQPYDYGKVRILYTDAAKEKQFVLNFDVAEDMVGESVEIPQYLIENGLGNPVLDEENKLLYSNVAGVFRYGASNQKNEQLMDFINSDLAISGIPALVPLEGGRFLAIYMDASGCSGGIFTKVSQEKVPTKAVLELGGAYLKQELRERVVAFNQASKDCRIVVHDYKYATGKEEEPDDGYGRLDEAIRKNAPDILVLNTYHNPVDDYAEKGILADVGAMLEADEELKNETFMMNVMDACRINGKLYEVIPSFGVSTYTGKETLFGHKSSWTLNDAAELRINLADTEDGTNGILSETSGPEFLERVMMIHGREWIDPMNKTCNLNSPEFIAYLEYAAGLPETVDVSAEENRFREDQVLLADCYIGSLQGMDALWNGSFGGDMTFVGFPAYSGAGISVIRADNTFAISAATEQPEEAWSFLRYYLTDEYQSTLTDSLPITKQHLEQNLQAISSGAGRTVYWQDGVAVTLAGLTATQTEKLMKLVLSVDRRSYYDTTVNAIVAKETAGLYSGKRSAADAANVIQSQVEEYLRKRK